MESQANQPSGGSRMRVLPRYIGCLMEIVQADDGQFFKSYGYAAMEENACWRAGLRPRLTHPMFYPGCLPDIAPRARAEKL